MDTLIWLWNIALVALGLGFVIFVHELGHFLVAKWNGVKVEKFSIGFGKTIFGFRRGETEYVVAAVPLGGFVKMLGEGNEEEGAPRSTDPRAFSNKPVGARMAIISAGVIMNLILALGCFAYTFLQPREQRTARVGDVVAGSPAFEAGLKPGDDIVGIDGKHAGVGFEDLTRAVNLSTRGQVVNFRVKRLGVEKELEFPIRPTREGDSELPTIGVRSGVSLRTVGYQPPAGTVDPPKFPWPPKSDEPLRQLLPTIVAAGPVGESSSPASDHEAFREILARHRDKPIELTVEDRPIRAGAGDPSTARNTVVLPPNRYVDFGFRLGVEPVSAIQKGSPAEAAGFRVGDRIVKVDGRDDFDPMRLASECFDHAGAPMTFEVQRKESGSPETKTVTLTAAPDDSSPALGEFVSVEPSREELKIPGLGLCFPVRMKIEAVRDDSPAAKAGLKPGDVIDAMTIPKTEGRPGLGAAEGKEWWLADRERTFHFDDGSAAWLSAFNAVQALPLQAVSFTVDKGAKTVAATPEIVADWFNPSRGLEFFPATRMVPALGVVDALKEGFHETVRSVSMMYAIIRSLFTGRVSPKLVGGPIGIAQLAYTAADTGFGAFLHFLGAISINLAVLNFLPIPPLDGGQMTFLLAEKVRGRPLPDSALIAGTYTGLLLVVCLMVFATYQDVFRLVSSYFN